MYKSWQPKMSTLRDTSYPQAAELFSYPTPAPSVQRCTMQHACRRGRTCTSSPQHVQRVRPKRRPAVRHNYDQPLQSQDVTALLKTTSTTDTTHGMCNGWAEESTFVSESLTLLGDACCWSWLRRPDFLSRAECHTAVLFRLGATAPFSLRELNLQARECGIPFLMTRRDSRV